MQVQWVLIQVWSSVLLLSRASAQVYDTSLNHYEWQHKGLVFGGFQSEGSNSSLDQPNGTDSLLLVKGFTALGLSVIGFGCSLVPIKSTETGDGIFFQWVFCTALFIGSFVVHIIQGFPSFCFASLLGGFLFSAGNLTTIPIIKTIGLGVGFLIWSTFSLLMGWASARFGWFGIDQQCVPDPALNYIGTALATISALIVFFIKMEEEGCAHGEETTPLLQEEPEISHSNQLYPPMDEECILTDLPVNSWENKLTLLQRKIIGSVLAVVAGLLYGVCYNPMIYVRNNALKNNSTGVSQYDLDYIFPYMTGVYVTTAIVFFVYCMIMKNRPYLPSKCVLPALFSGSLQCASQITWFIACYFLGTLITYPIGTAVSIPREGIRSRKKDSTRYIGKTDMGPALVSLIWSVFYFREIKGTKNLLILVAVLVTVLSGVTLITISKIN